MLGFVTIKRGPRPKYTNTFRLTDGWRDLDATQAKRRRLQAFQPLPKPPAKPRVVRHIPSLPRMPWDRVT
jgi:hypothetical protein